MSTHASSNFSTKNVSSVPLCAHVFVPLFFAFLSFLVTGCTTIDSSRVMLDVPFTAQLDNYCGVSSLDMVLRYYKFNADQERLRKEIHIPALEGTIAALIVEAAEKEGARANIETGSNVALRDWLQKGIPPIVFLVLSEEEGSKGHFAVVTGMKKDGRLISMHSGEKPDGWYDSDVWFEWWKWGGYKAVIVEKP